jgi:hypothetical protein
LREFEEMVTPEEEELTLEFPDTFPCRYRFPASLEKRENEQKPKIKTIARILRILTIKAP